jgi:hypothetical protein
MTPATARFSYEYMLWRAGAFDKVKTKIMKKIKVIQVCSSDCEKKEFTAKVGNKTTNFCCKKGFEKSLRDFSRSISNPSKQQP